MGEEAVLPYIYYFLFFILQTYINAPANFNNPKCFIFLCTTSKAAEEPAELVSPPLAMRSQPAQHGEGFDAPPTL